MDAIVAISIRGSLNSRPRAGVRVPTRRPLPFKRRPMTGRSTTSATVRLVEGWLVSLFLHGLLLSATLPLFRQMPITIPAEPFRWDINLVRSTQVTHEPLQTTGARAPEQHEASYTVPATAIPAKVKDTSRASTTYAESKKPVLPIHKRAAATESPLQNAPSTAPIDTAPVVQESTQYHNIAAAAEPVSSPPALEHSSVPAPSTNDPPVPMSESTATLATPEQPVQVPVVAGTGGTSVRGFESAAPRQPEATTPAEVVSPSAPRADYSWLQQAIFRRLEELKRSSRPSLDYSSPLKVLVKAVVSSEGNLMDTEVVKSSGLDRIDKEAVALVQRAFPIQLDRALDHQRIVMRIPITYSRD
jgi:TonB family protein